MGKITEEEMAMLSDEEREALDGETDAKTTEEIKAEEDAAAAEAAKAEEEKAAEAAKVDADAAAAAKAAEAPVIASKVEPAFTLAAETTHGTKEEIEAKMVALDTQFEDGDITLAAYNKERAGYVETLTEIRMFDKINAQVKQSAAEKGWKDAQADFFASNPEYSSERIKNVAFVDAVNRLLATDESKKMTDAQVFEAAKKECDTVFYPAGRKAADNKATSAEDRKKAIDAARKAEADRAAGVKTLSKVPISEGNQGDDKYDAIDKLSGDEFESAVARMTDTERAIYAARS